MIASAKGKSSLLIEALGLFVLLFAVPWIPAEAARSGMAVMRTIDMGPGCRIRLRDSLEGESGSGMPGKGGYQKAPAPAKTTLDALSLNWSCLAINDPAVGEFMKYDKVKDVWEADFARLLNTVEGGRERVWAHKWFAANYKVVQWKSANASGYAVIDRTQTDFSTIPTEKDKSSQRSGPVQFSFCVLRSPKAICGGGQVGLKQEGAKGDLTPFALDIVRSIEFAD